MLSELRARPAPLLLLTSVLSETLAAKGDHISFVIGPFRPRLGPPLRSQASGTEPPPGRAVISGTGKGPARRVREPRGQSRRHQPASSSFRNESPSGTRVAPAAPRLPGFALAVPWPPGALHNSPNSGCVRAPACPRFLCFAASSTPPRTPVIGTDRNSESF
jgi:hypothetical protein